MKPLLHVQTAAQFEAAISAGMGYIFHGPRGSGTKQAAWYLAQRLNCQGDDPNLCQRCRLFVNQSFPDVIAIAPEVSSHVTIEQARSLTQALSLSPYYADSIRVVIIEAAHRLTTQAQNALLKLIEEPPPRTRIVLVAEQIEGLLPTVRSRLAEIYFVPVPVVVLSEWLEREHKLPATEARRLAHEAGGLPGHALRLHRQADASTARSSPDDSVQAALNAPTFQRLLIARQIADAKTDVQAWGNQLQRAVLDQLNQSDRDPKQISRQLDALEVFRRSLVANVGPRVALERLMLELE